jgi:c-di-GMP-binding flagellar brake protein YcgR
MERRKYKRFPVIRDFSETVEITFSLPQQPSHLNKVPGIVLNLSAGGMALLTFISIPVGSDISFKLSLPNTKNAFLLKGKVVRVENHENTYLAGIKFEEIDEEVKKLLTKMGEDYENCEIRLSFNIADGCYKECSYYPLCNKKIKIK